MEKDRLQAFYESLSVWPGGEIEVSAIAEKVAKLLDAPAVGFLSTLRDPRFGVFVLGASPENSRLLPSTQELLRKQISGIDDFKKLTQIEGAFPGFSGQGQNQINNLSFQAFENASIRREEEFNPNISQREHFGWLVVGTTGDLTKIQQILIRVAAERMAELSKICELERTLQLRNQFLSIASHELKTPLTSIYGILQLQDRIGRLKQDTVIALPPGDQKRSYVKILLRQVERLNELIDGLLDISRIQNGRFMVDPTEVDVAALLRETIQGRLQVIATEAGVKLSVEAPSHLKARVDPVRMEEVVTNLVMNAIRFSPEGGVVWIRLRQDDKAFRMTVRDQGPNVDPEDRERLFKPYERVQRTTRMGGLGLGLFISRQIAIMHGGNVSLVESVPGKGNVIEAYFPI